jgi:hypothetical protein
MAFIDKDIQGGDSFPTFYNLSQAVGYGCLNWAEDVKIVQFFLKRLYSLPKYQSKKPSGDDMVVDGKMGPITRTWIRKYQADCLDHGIPTSFDGIVDKAGHKGGNYMSSITKSFYTIRVLNNMMRVNDPAVYKTLPTNPAVPPDVRLIFIQIQAQGPPMDYGDD